MLFLKCCFEPLLSRVHGSVSVGKLPSGHLISFVSQCFTKAQPSLQKAALQKTQLVIPQPVFAPRRDGSAVDKAPRRRAAQSPGVGSPGLHRQPLALPSGHLSRQRRSASSQTQVQEPPQAEPFQSCLAQPLEMKVGQMHEVSPLFLSKKNRRKMDLRKVYV